MVKLEEILFIVAIISYLVCSGLYIWNLITRSSIAAKSGTIILVLGLVAHTAALIIRWDISGHAPMSNSYESLSLFGWGIVLFYLIAERLYPIRAAGALVVPSAFIITGIALILYTGPESLSPALQSVWLWIHVTIAMLSYGLFALAFGAGFFYIIQEYLLKKNYSNVLIAFMVIFGVLGIIFGYWISLRWWANPAYVANPLGGQPDKIYATSDYLKIIGGSIIGLFVSLGLGYLAGKGAAKSAFTKRLPSLDVLDEVSYRSVAFGFPMLTIAIVTGAIWADQAWGSWWSWDAKETWSLITWLFYGAYLHTRFTYGWRGRHTAILAVVGLLVVLFTYFGVNYWLPGLHSYASIGTVA